MCYLHGGYMKWWKSRAPSWINSLSKQDHATFWPSLDAYFVWSVFQHQFILTLRQCDNFKWTYCITQIGLKYATKLWQEEWHLKLLQEQVHEADVITAHVSSYDFIWFILGQCLRLILIIVVTAMLRGGETSVTSALSPSDNDAWNDKVDHSEEENGGDDEINGT